MKETRMQLYTWVGILLALILTITHTREPHPLVAASADGRFTLRRDTTNVLTITKEQTPGSEVGYTLILPTDLNNGALNPGQQKANETVAAALHCQKRFLQAATVDLER